MSLKKLPGITVQPIIVDTYLAFITASEGTPLFRSFYAFVNGKKRDITQDGKLSCALFTSSILKLFNMVSEVQVTKNRLVRDMHSSGWQEIKRPRTGCVVIWGAKPADSARMKKDEGIYQTHVEHCGFYLGNNIALSTGGDQDSRVPVRHPLNYRPILQYLWHPALEKQFTNPIKKSNHKPGIYWQPNK